MLMLILTFCMNRYKWGAYNQVYKPQVVVAAVGLLLQSKGNVTLRSNDWREPPALNLNYLSAPGDMDIMVSSFKLAREVVGNMSLVESEWFPGPSVSTDAEIENFIKYSSYSCSYTIIFLFPLNHARQLPLINNM